MLTLHEAITRRNPCQVRLLTNVGCNVNRLDSRMRSPLCLVCELNNELLAVSLGSLLLKNGAAVHQKDEFGISVFCYACIKQRTRLVQCMIREREISWLDKDHKGNTALHHAAETGNCLITQMIVKQMRKYGLNIDRRNNRGETPLVLAEKLGNFQCAKLLRHSGKASTAAREELVFKNAEEWRNTWTERVPRKLSSYFSTKFPEVAAQLTETRYIKRPPTADQETKPHDKPNKHPVDTGKSVTKDALPRLLMLLKEQQMDSFRASAKPPNNNDQIFGELQDSSEDETSRQRGDQMTVKRKAFSYAGLPMLAQQRFSSIKNQNRTVQNCTICKDTTELNTAKKLTRRRSTASVMENMSEAARERKAVVFKTVQEENTKQFAE